MTPKQLLAIKMPANDAGTATVAGYLKALLLQLWEEEECFDGKRPFGNSDWQQDILLAFEEAGVSNPYAEVFTAIKALR